MGVYQKTIGPITAVPIRRLGPLFLFWLAALALLLIPGLDLPIRDWDEGIVARVAYERGDALLQWLSGQASFINARACSRCEREVSLIYNQ